MISLTRTAFGHLDLGSHEAAFLVRDTLLIISPTIQPALWGGVPDACRNYTTLELLRYASDLYKRHV